jgi:predicted hotdog family 3-hydroxylacyl-ACP dehydratase
MCLLDRVQRWDDSEIVCETSSHRDADNPLRHDGVLPAVCGVEYVAQAIGIHGRVTQGNHAKPRAGYLTSLRDLTMHVQRLDDIERPLLIWAKRLADTGETVMCEFAMRDQDLLLLSGRATLLLETR